MNLQAMIGVLDARHDPREVGRFELVDGKIEMRFRGDPDYHHGHGRLSDREMLTAILGRSAFVGPLRREVRADTEPDAWLRALPEQYRGIYAWAVLIGGTPP